MESCCCLVRTKKAELSCDDAGSATTAAQCFGSLMQLPNPESLQAYLHSLFPREFSWRIPGGFPPWHKERCFNVLVGSLRPACAGEGGQLSAAAAVTGYSGLSLNDGSPPQC